MKKFVVFVLLVSSILSADPIPTPFINEFQTSPDSLQRIEVAYYHTEYQGIIVITNTCSTYVDSPLISDEFAVIDMENTYGILDLNDTCDTIIVFFEYLWWADTVIYPADRLFAPEPYTSASVFEYVDWYIDSTPTFGSENDDYPYCIISGAVFNLDSLPIKYAEVQASRYYQPPYLVDTVDPNGSYSFTDLMPGGYTLIATHTNYQPDTTQVSTYALFPAAEINFYLIPVPGISEEVTEISAELFVYPNPFVGKTVISLECINRVDAAVTRSQHSICIYDLTGRLVRTLPLLPSPFAHRSSVVWDGRDDRGINAPPGVYFVKWRDSSRVNSTLICKLR